MTTPTKAAMRAAAKIYDDPIAVIAKVIDRETHMAEVLDALRKARHAMEWYDWHKCSDHDCMEWIAIRAVNEALAKLEGGE